MHTHKGALAVVKTRGLEALEAAAQSRGSCPSNTQTCFFFTTAGDALGCYNPNPKTNALKSPYTRKIVTLLGCTRSSSSAHKEGVTQGVGREGQRHYRGESGPRVKETHKKGTLIPFVPLPPFCRHRPSLQPSDHAPTLRLRFGLFLSSRVHTYHHSWVLASTYRSMYARTQAVVQHGLLQAVDEGLRPDDVALVGAEGDLRTPCTHTHTFDVGGKWTTGVFIHWSFIHWSDVDMGSQWTWACTGRHFVHCPPKTTGHQFHPTIIDSPPTSTRACLCACSLACVARTYLLHHLQVVVRQIGHRRLELLDRLLLQVRLSMNGRMAWRIIMSMRG